MPPLLLKVSKLEKSSLKKKQLLYLYRKDEGKRTHIYVIRMCSTKKLSVRKTIDRVTPTWLWE